MSQPPAGNGNEAILEVRDLSFYYGSFRGLTNFSLNIAKNLVSAFIGPS